MASARFGVQGSESQVESSVVKVYSADHEFELQPITFVACEFSGAEPRGTSPPEAEAPECVILGARGSYNSPLDPSHPVGKQRNESQMDIQAVTTETLAGSVIAVPPLARNPDLSLNRDENSKLVRHLESGGVSTILYGGNAVLYHTAPSEFDSLLGMLAELASEDTLVIPSVGPAFGTMMDQAAILREHSFPTAMVLPTRDVCTSDGVASAVRRFVEAAELPAVLYIKHDGFIGVDAVEKLVRDGLISWIKYAIVRDDTSDDPYLRELTDAIGTSQVVSGIGEQPAIVHLTDFGLTGFTSGCVCIAPSLSMEMLRAIQSRDLAAAEAIRLTFRPLEDLRNSIHPVRVLHAAVTGAGVANCGPILPPLSDVAQLEYVKIERAANELLLRCAQV